LQCVAVCCSVLQCIAVCCSVLQCVAVCCSVLQCVATNASTIVSTVILIRANVAFSRSEKAIVCAAWIMLVLQHHLALYAQESGVKKRQRVRHCFRGMSHTWISHITHMDESRHAYECVILQVWKGRGTRKDCVCAWRPGGNVSLEERVLKGAKHCPARQTLTKHMNESCHTHECVMSNIWMGHVIYERFMSYMDESCHECVMSHVWMRHVTHVNESCHTWISGVTHMNPSGHMYECIVSSMWMCHVTLTKLIRSKYLVRHGPR